MAEADPVIVKTSIVRRRASRDSLFLSATIRRRSDGETELVPVRVRNLSAVGLMADYTEAVAEGEPVIVTVRGLGDVPGKVAWVRGGRIGVEFDAQVDPKLARKPVKPTVKPLAPPLRPLP